MSLATKKIGLIIGSVRQNRIGDKVATFVKELLESESTSTSPQLSIVDVASFNLPVFNEPIMPAMVPAKGEFIYEHSKAWSAEIGKYDAYILISPEYNFGPPGGIKNAIDYLYNTWIGKPIMVLTYGIMGGNSASEALSKTLTGMHLNVVDTKPQLTFPGADPAQHNMSPGLMASMGGVLDETSKVAWAGQKDEILKGLGELKDKLAAVPAATAA